MRASVNSVIAELFDDVIGGGTKSARAAHAMVASDVFEIALRSFAREFLRQERRRQGQASKVAWFVLVRCWR